MLIPTSARPELVCAKSEGRYAIDRPWFKDGHIYATDGRIAVKIPVNECKDDHSGSIRLDALKLMRSTNRNVHSITMSKKGIEVPLAKATFDNDCQDKTVDVERVLKKTESEDKKIKVKLNAKLLEKLARSMGAEAVELTLSVDEFGVLVDVPIKVEPVYALRVRKRPVIGAVGVIMMIDGL